MNILKQYLIKGYFEGTLEEGVIELELERGNQLVAEAQKLMDEEDSEIKIAEQNVLITVGAKGSTFIFDGASQEHLGEEYRAWIDIDKYGKFELFDWELT